ncbi:hypothetical protein U9M48_005692 [Paspalum notatum var. saurae]|uniref:Uncharacterized protein n=1 Tax=Paspalum notatum var. saurae TaxID=547442 RepID=A0AAQ3SFM2_PASNO
MLRTHTRTLPPPRHLPVAVRVAADRLPRRPRSGAATPTPRPRPRRRRPPPSPAPVRSRRADSPPPSASSPAASPAGQLLLRIRPRHGLSLPLPSLIRACPPRAQTLAAAANLVPLGLLEIDAGSSPARRGEGGGEGGRSAEEEAADCGTGGRRRRWTPRPALEVTQRQIRPRQCRNVEERPALERAGGAAPRGCRCP